MRGLFMVAWWSCAVVAGAQEATAQNSTSAPVLTLEISDVAALRARLAASWYGRLWASPAATSLPGLVQDRLLDVATATGIDWPRIAAQTTRISLALGGERSLTLTLAEPAEPLLASALMVAQQTEERWAAYYAAVEVLAGQVPDPDGPASSPYPKAPGSLVAIEKSDAGFVLARSSRYSSFFERMDGWLVSAEDRSLRLSTPTDHPPRSASRAIVADGDISVHLDLPRWMDALGLPGASEALRASGVGMMDGTITIDPEHSHEHLRLIGAKLPLRVLDRALLERWVPANALAVSAIGIDGAKLPAFADQVAAQRVDLAAMIAVLRDRLHSVDGTAWFAVVPGNDVPGFVAGLSATPDLDRWIATLVPAVAEQVASGKWEPVPVPLGDSGEVVLLRTAECWLAASESALLTPARTGGFFTTRTGGVSIPAEAMAIGVQDNATLLRTIARYAPQVSRFLRALPAEQTETPQALPRWMYHARKTVAEVLDQLAGLATVTTAPVSVSYLIPTSNGMAVEGRDMLAGMLAFPLLGVATTEVLPFIMPEWSRRHHPLWACASAGESVPWYEHTSWSVGGAYLKAPPWWRAQHNTTALASPSSSARGHALMLLHSEDDQVQTDWAFALCRGALRDPIPAIREGAWYGIAGNHRGHEAEFDGLVVAMLRDPDLDLRRRACGVLDGCASLVRSRRMWDAFGDHEPLAARPLPSEALDILLDLERSESNPHLLESLLGALSGYDDPRILPRLVARLTDPQASVRAGAAVAIGRSPATDHDLPSIQAVARLLSDQADATAWHFRVGDQAVDALRMILGAEVDALLVAELSRPDLPGRGYFTLSRHEHLLRNLLLRKYVPAIDLVRQRVKASGFKAVDQLGWVLARWAVPESEVLLREWLETATATTRPQVLELLSTYIAGGSLQSATIERLVGIVASATEEADDRAVDLLHDLLAKDDQRAAVVPLIVPLLTSDQQAVRSAARTLVNDLVEEPTTPTDLMRPLQQAIAAAWKQFGAEAFPDYEPPPEPPPAPTNVKNF